MALRAGTVFHGTVGQPTAQVIDGSLKFERRSSNYLSRTFGAGNRKTYTVSFWHKHSNHSEGSSIGTGGGVIFSTGTVGAGARGTMGFGGPTNGSNEDSFSIGHNATGSTWKSLNSDAFFRDFAAWQHFVIAVDCTQGTASNRVKFYVNGVQQSLNGSYPNNENQQFNNNVGHAIGRYNPESSDYYSGLLSDFYFIDGQQLDESDFGFTDPQTNTWRPKKYTGTFGTNGFYLPMDNEDDFEIDKSGKGNNWTKNGFSGTSINPDVVKDSPSGAVSGGRAQTGITTTSSAPANYCTLNPIDAFVSTKDGNLETVTSSGWQGIRATLGMKSGKFYWETQNNQTAAAILGIADTEATGFVDGAIFGSTGHGGGDANPAWTWAGANYYFNATSAASGSLANHTSSDIVQYAFDADSGNLWFGRNGTWYSSSWATTGDPANGVNPTVSGIDTTKTYVACGSFYNGSGKFNFGQKPFKYAPPQGFLPINSASARPETVFARPDRYIQVLKYTGDDATTHSITGLNFGAVPDFVWIKNRNQSEKHILHDTVRGVGDTLYSTSNDHDTGSTYSDRYKSFDLNGFTVGSTHTSTNSNGDDFSAVCWKAGGSSNTFNVDGVGYASAADAGLDGGDLTVTGASVGTKQGFSIIKYQGSGSSGDQVPHGLSQTPNLAFVKQAGNSGSGTPWDVYHSGYYAAGSKNYLRLNNDDGAGYASDMFQTPTSSFMTFGSSNSQNGSSYNYIMYCWHDVPGLQKFGSYTGNGSDDGPFIETGFRPTLIWTRAYDGTGVTNNAGWFIYDTLDDSNPYNDDAAVQQPGNYITYAHLLNPLQSHADMGIDILSNGFRLRADSSGYSNKDGWSYIYGAFAAAPVSNLFGGQSTGR